jgi:hypothetical protein
MIVVNDGTKDPTWIIVHQQALTSSAGNKSFNLIESM